MHQLNARKPSTLLRMVRVQSGELENLSIDSAAIENADSKKSLEQIEQGEDVYSMEKNDAVMDSNGTFFFVPTHLQCSKIVTIFFLRK